MVKTGKWMGYLGVLLVCCACSAESATPTAAGQQFIEPTAAPATHLEPALLFSLTGDTFTTSEPFAMDAPGEIEIAWEYSGEGQFSFWILNNNEFANDPDYDRILIKNIDTHEASGKQELRLIAGEYVIDVEIADAPWKITVQLLP